MPLLQTKLLRQIQIPMTFNIQKAYTYHDTYLCSEQFAGQEDIMEKE